jgi:hypothetical protein
MTMGYPGGQDNGGSRREMIPDEKKLPVGEKNVNNRKLISWSGGIASF